MKNTIVTGSLIVFSDGFVWKRLSNEKAYKIWVSAENEDFELYKVRVDDESESLIESLEDLQDAFKQGHHVCIEVGKLPYSIGLNYLRNLQEMSVVAVDEITGPKEYSREQAFSIIQVESRQSDWFKIDKEIFMQPENKNKAFILGTRKTGCDLIILGGTNCDEGSMDWLFGSLGNENFYVCKPLSFYKSQQEIQKVNPLYAFKVATAYFREQGKVPVFEDSNCRLIKL